MYRFGESVLSAVNTTEQPGRGYEQASVILGDDSFVALQLFGSGSVKAPPPGAFSDFSTKDTGPGQGDPVPGLC